MDTSVRRIKTKKEFETAIEDAVVEGWKLKSRGDHVAVLRKSGGYGSIVGHGLIFVLTVWWTFFLGNLVYGAYRYMSGAKELIIKME